MAKVIAVLLISMACSHTRAPATPAAAPTAAGPAAAPDAGSSPAVATADAAPAVPVCPSDARIAALAPSPGHQLLAWLVDLIAHRNGDAPRDELTQHLDAAFLGPASTTVQGFHHWAANARCATVEKIEVDDPTYIRAFIATPEKRWVIILQIDPAVSKLTYLRFEPAP